MTIGHQKQRDFLKRKFESGKLSHAYLFLGESQLGKTVFAKEFVKLINCLAEKEKPCQKCHNCKMIDEERFPDLFLIKSSDQEITIDKIREAQNFLSYKSYYGSFKSVIIDGAEKMNQEAQSCFLKTLEEPKGKTVIIFISLRPGALLATIASRCQIIKLFPAGRNLIENYTEKEKKLLEELSKVIDSDLAEKFRYAKQLELEAGELNEILAVLIKYFREILQKKIESQESLSLPKIKKDIELVDYIHHLSSSYNINPKLALEYLLVEL